MINQLDLTEDHVARATRAVEKDLSLSKYTPATETDFDRMTERVLSRRPAGPIKIFAYGSLIWKPTFEATGRQVARAQGWHREFSMIMRGFRGTPEAPGLMMTMMSGGQCRGVSFEIDEREAEDTVRNLVERELPFVETGDDYRWIDLTTENGREKALVFWAGPTGEGIARGLPPAEAAQMIARACGWLGSNAEYLRNTILSLEEHDIHDARLWQLQRLVAAEIDRIFPKS
jgi:cation transport protein ChaC